MTNREIAASLGISENRVEQLLRSGLRKAKAILEANGYTLRDLIPDQVVIPMRKHRAILDD